jgi:hypothetical protein
MRESIYLFKQGFQPVWEDRRNINGGSWTFRVPKANGPDFWTRVQLMAIGEKLQGCLDLGKPFYFYYFQRLEGWLWSYEHKRENNVQIFKKKKMLSCRPGWGYSFLGRLPSAGWRITLFGRTRVRRGGSVHGRKRLRAMVF